MKRFLSNRSKLIKPSGIRKYFDEALLTEGALSLGVGEPDFPLPKGAAEAMVSALCGGNTRYTENRGSAQLRELISEYLLKRFNVEYPPDRIIVTVGASEGIDLALRATVNEGDEVLLPEPSYVAYRPLTVLAGGVPVAVPCGRENQFRLTAENLESKITKKSKILILSYPNNPTGSVMKRQHLEGLLPVIKEHDLLVISDEIYAELTFEGRHVSVASIGDMSGRTVLAGGFSKAFSMTGLRVGFVCSPGDIDGAMLKIHQYCAMCAPTVSQAGAERALKDAIGENFKSLNDNCEKYRKRGAYMAEILTKAGLECHPPEGAFYAFARVKGTGLDGDEFSKRLMQSKKVAVVSGSAFGNSGKDYIRLSFAASPEVIKEALKRIADFVREL